jgi:two-component system, cell cycle sensor histidine kinase and response regulator CckA
MKSKWLASFQTGRYLGKSPAVIRYGAALLLVALSTAVGLWVGQTLVSRTPYLFYFPAILISLWLAGFAPGLLATVLSAIVADYLFITPYYTLYANPGDVIRAIYFVASFGFICWLIDARQYRAEIEIEHQAEALEHEKDERQILEEQFRQAQKMEAIGRLAGGVAHDFNNLLTVILGQTELLKSTGISEDAQKRLDEITAAAERAGALTSQLLAFSRKQMLKMEPLELNVVVQQFSSVLARLLGEDIRTEVVLDPLLEFIRGDKNQIEQVLMNLAVNSRDAMPDGGKFIIETARVVLDQQYAKTHSGVAPGHYAMLAVSDTGVGMDDDTKSHIFEPFFTTKGLGKGTGLGLSMVYGTVKQLQGIIWVYSEVGQGTTFKMYFPMTKKEDLANKPDLAARVPSERLNLTVLVVEDNESLLQLIKDYLEVEGCTVIATGNGNEALAQATTFEGEIHLLLTDVILPGKNGKQVADDVIRKRPEIKVIYTSGYTPNAIVHHGVLDKGVHFLQKPFTRAELLSIFKAATLDQRTRS